MNQIHMFVIWGLLVGVPFPDTATAQAPAPLLFDLPASTEAMGLGNVFPVSGRDASAVFYNPGALAEARGAGVAAQRIGQGSTLFTGSAALPWLGGGVGFGVQALADDARSGAPPTEADLVSDGDEAVSEMSASLGYAREVGPVHTPNQNPN